jgi:CheY-like chemotaxis protein
MSDRVEVSVSDRRGQTTLLLVEDDVVLGRVLSRVLALHQYRVAWARSIREALTKTAEVHPDLALLDLCLPDGKGTDLAERLRAERPDLPLILMTAYPLDLRDHPEVEKAFVRVLKKPIGLDQLRTTLDVALHKPTAIVS